MGDSSEENVQFEATQRLLRRDWLLQNIPLWLRESKYHRDYDAEEDLPRLNLWTWEDDEGSCRLDL